MYWHNIQDIYQRHIIKSHMLGRYHTGHVKCVVTPSFGYYRTTTGFQRTNFAAEIRRGLDSSPKSIPPKFFYDTKGSLLFEEICSLPEYYLTRTETAILTRIRHKLVDILNDRFRLVELGSGSSTKTRLLLDAMQAVNPRIRYTPIDISDILEGGAGSLEVDYPDLIVTGIVDTYERGLALLKHMDESNNLVAFLGSSMGNMDHDEAVAFMRHLREQMKPDDLFLVGLDMVKDTRIIKAAYDDSQGVTARFNLNVLHRINSEIGANFDTDMFAHHVSYNRSKNRIEMYLRSLRAQTVYIPGAGITVHLGRDELIHTENSYKYTVSQIYDLAESARFDVKRLWQDDDRLFSLVLMSPC